jgi:hypothetical protein
METQWFEFAVISAIFAVGNIYFGHFEEQTPKWRRTAKFVLINGFAITLSAIAGRIWFYLLLGCMGVMFAIVHGWWLPRHGIHGLTGEPKERYYQLRGWKQ